MLPLSLDRELFEAFAFYAGINLVKQMAVQGLTSYYRISKKVVSNPEDKLFGEIKMDDEDVERVRRCHQNDIENIYMFVLAGSLYCLVARPNYETAVWHFRIFTVARVLHSICYLGKIPQPSRTIAYVVGFGVCASMIGRIFLALK